MNSFIIKDFGAYLLHQTVNISIDTRKWKTFFCVKHIKFNWKIDKIWFEIKKGSNGKSHVITFDIYIVWCLIYDKLSLIIHANLGFKDLFLS